MLHVPFHPPCMRPNKQSVLFIHNLSLFRSLVLTGLLTDLLLKQNLERLGRIISVSPFARFDCRPTASTHFLPNTVTTGARCVAHRHSARTAPTSQQLLLQ